MSTTTYVVTGLERTGTSMMMRAVDRSSFLVPVRDIAREAQIEQFKLDPDYEPNPNGYYVPPDFVFPHHASGQLIKCGAVPWGQVPPDTGPYLVIEMTRNEASRMESYERAFGEMHQSYVDVSLMYLGLMRQRPDVSLTIVAYEDVMTDPLSVFTRLVEAGWPINAEKAAALVDQELHRYK